MSNNKLSRRNFLGGGAVLTAAASVAPQAISSGAQAPQSQRGLKFYMHWDMEGASGIFTREQAWYWEPGARPEVILEARRLLTGSMNSASSSALAAGATELIVCDTHHGGGNALPEMLLRDPRITYHYRSVGLQDGKLRWMPGLDETVAALMVLGQHAKAGTGGAFLPHTSTRDWADFRINGLSVGEFGIQTCYAGHWDVPLIFVHGEETACQQARQQFPGILTAAVKWAVTPELSTGFDPDVADRLTALLVGVAVERTRTHKPRPFKPTLPMTVTIRMVTTDLAAKAAARPGVRRIDDHTVEARVARQCDVLKWITGTGLDMTP